MMNGHLDPVEMKNCVNLELNDDDEENQYERRGTIYQILMGLLANTAVIGTAMTFGYSAVALEPLKSPHSDIKINEQQGSWIATASSVGTPFGCLISSFIMRRGRKISLLTTTITCSIGWLIIYFSTSYEQIIGGRILTGIASGLASVPVTVYCAEIASTTWRSTMVTWTSVSIAVGVLIVYTLGYFFPDNWRLVALICSLFPMVASGLILILIPESPIWLRDRGRVDEALAILKKFRGVPKNRPATENLLEEIRPRQQKKETNLLKYLLKRNAMVPFAIMLTFFFFQQFSGIFVMVYYAVDIIKSTGVTVNAYFVTVLIGITRLIGSIIVATISKKFGRRIPAVISGAGMALSMGILSLYLFLINRGYDLTDLSLLPIVCILGYIFISTTGFLPLPFAMVGEVYPSNVKDILSGITSCIGYTFSSITVKIHPDLLIMLGSHGIYFFYTVMSLMGMIFVLIFLPETKGKTFHEIEDMFSKKRKRTIRKQNNNDDVQDIMEKAVVLGNGGTLIT